jgi:hypothetical protein
MFMLGGVAGVLFVRDICVECMSIPGMSAMGDCLVCAFTGSVADSTNASVAAVSVWCIVIPSLEDCVAANSVENAGRRESQEGIRYGGLCGVEREAVASGL